MHKVFTKQTGVPLYFCDELCRVVDDEHSLVLCRAATSLPKVRSHSRFGRDAVVAKEPVRRLQLRIVALSEQANAREQDV